MEIKNNFKFVLTIGLTAVISISATLAVTININNKRVIDSSNHNSMTVLIDGEMVTVTAEKYEELIRENERLLGKTEILENDNKTLAGENEELQNKLDKINENGNQDFSKELGVDTNVGKKEDFNSEAPDASGTDLMDITTSDAFFVDKFELFEGPDNKMYGLALEFIPGNESYITYDLGNNYAAFTASVMTSKEPPEGTKIAIGIYLDDKSIENYELTYKDRIQKIGPIDVSGAGKLTIKTKDLNNYSSGLCYLVNGSLQ